MHHTVSHPNTETSTQQYTELIQPATHSVQNTYTYIPIQHTTIPTYIHIYTVIFYYFYVHDYVPTVCA